MTDSEPGPDRQHDAQDAHVQVLTAEVRTLVAGSRQVTLSVYEQLDEVSYDDVEPFGRVSPRGGEKWKYNVVGRNTNNGTLVRAGVRAGRSTARAPQPLITKDSTHEQ